MLSLAKNDRGFRFASMAILLAPIAWLIFVNSRSDMVDLIVGISWCIMAALGLIAFLYEKAEEEDSGHN